MSRRWLPVLLLAAALAGLPPGAGAPSVASTHVHMEEFAFNPQNVTILVGESVDWDNHDALPHTVTADDGSFNSGNIPSDGTYERTFNSIATIPYHCAIHGGMTGTIIVSDPSALPDLVVNGVTVNDTLPGVGKVITIQVRNLGNNVAGASVAKVEYLYQGARVLVGEAEFGLLGPGATASETVSWSTLGKVGQFELVITADSDGDVFEASEGNNEASATTAVLVNAVAGVDLLDPA